MTEIVPHVLERRIVPKVWGGRALERLLGVELPAATEVGETWELFDRPDGSSGLRGTGASLRDLMEQDAGALLGPGIEPSPGGRFPLALKLIDAAGPLSVQVHPDDEGARAAGECGKSEAWVVLHAGPDACIRRGLRAGVDRARFEAALAGEGVLELLETFVPRRGETIHVPPGTVHAIGPDVVVFEIQRNSDLTYRLWDWGRDRRMDLEAGLAAVAYGREPQTTVPPEPIPGGGQWLVKDPCFRVRRFELREPSTFGTEGSFKVLTVLAGQLSVGWRSSGEHLPLHARQGDSVLVPAATGTVFLSPVGRVELLVSDAGEGR